MRKAPFGAARFDPGWLLFGLVAGGMLVTLLLYGASLLSVGELTRGRPLPPQGSAILGGWLLWPLHAGTVACVVCGLAVALRYDRGADRYEPWSLLAVGLAVLGLSAGSAGAARAMESWMLFVPRDLLRASQALSVAAVVAGFAAMARLHLVHLRRRGGVLAMCSIALAATCGWMLEAFVVRGLAAPTERDGIELARSRWADSWCPGPYDRFSVARVFADGRIELDGELLGAEPTHARLVEELAQRAARMDQLDGVPDEPLVVRADRRAPAAALARITGACSDPRVRIWKVLLRVDVVREGTVAEVVFLAKIAAYLPVRRTGEPLVQPGAALEVRADPQDDARYVVAGVPATDREDARRRVRELALATDEVTLGILVDEEVRWQAVVSALEVDTRGFWVVTGIDPLAD